MNDLDELKRLAKAATPGDWEPFEHGVGEFCVYANDSRDLAVVFVDMGDYRYDTYDFDQCAVNMEYIASANPATILELLDRLERAEKINDFLLKKSSYGITEKHRAVLYLPKDFIAPDGQYMLEDAIYNHLNKGENE